MTLGSNQQKSSFEAGKNCIQPEVRWEYNHLLVIQLTKLDIQVWIIFLIFLVSKWRLWLVVLKSSIPPSLTNTLSYHQTLILAKNTVFEIRYVYSFPPLELAANISRACWLNPQCTISSTSSGLGIPITIF